MEIKQYVQDHTAGERLIQDSNLAFVNQNRGQQTLSVKGQIVNILGFVGHTVSDAKAAIDYVNEWAQRYSNNTLFAKI